MDSQATSHGIDTLIARLHGEGVDAGRREAERILAEARASAEQLLSQARAAAQACQAEARAAASAQAEAAGHALELARRDALLILKDELCVQLAGRLTRLVAQAGRDETLLRRVLSAALDGIDDAALADVDRLLANTLESLLAEGINSRSGLHLSLQGQEVHIDLSDQALGELLGAQLLPRFRARLDGAVSG